MVSARALTRRTGISLKTRAKISTLEKRILRIELTIKEKESLIDLYNLQIQSLKKGGRIVKKPPEPSART